MLNLQDNYGRQSFTPTIVYARTGGSTKLGGNPNPNQPKPGVHYDRGDYNNTIEEDNPYKYQEPAYGYAN